MARRRNKLKPRPVEDAPLTVADELSRAGVQNVEPFIDILMPFTLWEHQIRGINKALRMPRFGLYHRPRLGKTMVFLLLAVYCAHYKTRSVILVPPILFKQIVDEWGKLHGNPFSLHVMKQGPAARDKLFLAWRNGKKQKPDVLLMTSQLFVKDHEWLKHLGYDVLVFDECHQGLAKETTAIYAAIKWFAEQKDSRLVLSTGTPVFTTPMNTYPIISLNNPEAYYDVDAFNRQHIVYKNLFVTKKNGNKVSLPTPDFPINIPEIHAALYEFGDRETGVGKVLINKPKIQVIPVALTRPHAALYQQIGLTRLVEFEDGSIINAVQAAKLRQVMAQVVTSPGEYGGKIKENAVISMVQEIINHYPTGEKIVVFLHYNSSCRTMYAALKDKHGAVLLYGKNSKTQNQRALSQFTDPEDKEHRVLVCSTLAGGVGLTLGDVSSTVIFAEIPETYGHLDQAMSRVVLVGKTEVADVYLLQALGTLWETRLPKVLERTAQIQEVNMDLSTLLDELMIKA